MAPGPVDWGLAERVGRRLAGREPLADSYHADSLERDLVELTSRAEDLVAATTGLRSGHGPARARVVDRGDWVAANVRSFQRLLHPVLHKIDDRVGASPAVVRRLTGTITGAEVGTLLGVMAQRVLGQYDLLVLEEEGADDQDLVYYVGPNVLSLEKRFGFPPREFRLWIALHEVTHRAQFTGVPWLRAHFLGLLEEMMGFVDPDPQRLLEGLRVAARGGAERDEALREGGLAVLFASPEQRAVLGRIGGLMSLLEGHGDVTMNRAGAGLVPSAERFARVLRERRKQVSGPMRVLRRLTGLEAKVAQYEQGERFIAAIERAAGPDAIDRCWEGPDRLPNLEEIREPVRWLERMGLPTAA